jgi:RNA polymerase sigma-70 factor (ECF subfamily)
MTEQTSNMNFENEILPHLDAAYNLARWLTRDRQDADDLVQEAFLRAVRYFGGFRGGNSRAWLLRIVRNTFYTRVRQTEPLETTTFEEEIHSKRCDSLSPEAVLLQSADHQFLRKALDDLPVKFRELLVLRELEGFSYKEIAEVADIPLGTVMSSLSRARDSLRQSLTKLCEQGASQHSSRILATR